jgi:hypothetical protein
MPPNASANEAWARSQLISAINGFRKTPKVKASTGPLQTNRPVTAPTTTHHGFLKLMPMKVSKKQRDDCAVGQHADQRRARPEGNP